MNKKQAAGEKAIEWIRDGMKVGLGTGSTVYYTILKLGELVQKGLRVSAVPTSNQTETLARQLGIPLTSFAEIDQLDLTIDGADAVTPELDLIKGGGGALLREKLVATSSKAFIVVVDDAKCVSNFNELSIPIEVVPFAWQATSKRIEALGGRPQLRNLNGHCFVTDNHNYILDTAFQAAANPHELHQNIKLITGVVETGLFTRMADAVIVSADGGTKVQQGPSHR